MIIMKNQASAANPSRNVISHVESSGLNLRREDAEIRNEKHTLTAVGLVAPVVAVVVSVAH